MNLFVALVCVAAAVGEVDVVAFSSTSAQLLTIGRADVPGAPTDRGLTFAIDTVDIDATTTATKNTWHTIYRIDDDTALEDWGQLGIDWAPWSELRPVVRARVVTPAGREYTLDPATLIDGQVGNTGGGVFSDRHRLQGPLPGVAKGAVVELEVVRTEIANRPMPFAFDRVVLGGWYPTAYSRLSVVTLRSTPLNAVAHGVAEGIRRRVIDDGPRRTTEYVLTAWPGAAKSWEPGQPDEIEDSALVSVSTASWSALATAYAEVVERQLRGFDAGAQLAAWKIDLTATPTVRQQQIIDAVGSNIRYTGLHVGDAAITPAPPAEVLARGFGDCKDLATLMTALLRAAGVAADVALIRSSDGLVRSDVPGSALFDHAIVAVRDGKNTTWIDATDQHAIATQVPSALQGKPALIASSSTKALTVLPTSRAADNTYREVRTVRLADEGAAHIVEETTATGTLGAWISARVHNRAEERQKELKEYATETWSAAHVTVDELAMSAAGPYRSTLTMTKAQRGFTNHNTASVYVDGSALASWLPATLTRTRVDDEDDDDEDGNEDGAAKAPTERKRPLQLATTMQTHVQYRIVPPAGYDLDALPPSVKRQWGPATYSEVWAREGATLVVDYDFVLDKRTLSAAEVTELRTAIAAWGKTTSTLVEFPHRAHARMTAGDAAGAIAAHRALIAARPSALEHERLAGRLLDLHLGDAAQREARAAVALEPNRATAHVTLAQTLMHDALGRWRGATVDVDAALASAKRALQLEPRNVFALKVLADALGFDAKGRTTTNLDAAREALAMLEALPNDERTELLRKRTLLLKLVVGAPTTARDFSHLKQGKELAALWPLLTTVPLNQVLTTFEAQTRPANRDAIRTELFPLLLGTRRYQHAYALMAYAAQQAQGAAALSKAVPCETVAFDMNTPDGFARALFRDALLGIPPRELRKRFADFDVFSSLRALEGERAAAVAGVPEGVSQAFICDATIDAFDTIVDGSDDDGYFVKVSARNAPGAVSTMFLTRVNGALKVVSFGVQGGALANELRTRAARSPASALRWLRWLDALEPPTTFDDPLDGDPVRLLIRANPNDDDIRLAVASLGLSVPALRHDALRDVGKRLADTRRPLPSQTRAVLQRTVASALALEGRCADLATVTRELALVAPRANVLEVLDLECALVAGDLARAERLATARHARLPDDRFAAATVPVIMLKLGRAADALAYQRAQTERNPSSGSAWNELAWLELVVGTGAPQEVLKHAERAVALTPTPGVKHTLALAQATAGDGVKALQTMTELQDANDNGFGENEWVVIGRAAEALGMPRYALTAYIRSAGDRLGDPDDSRAIAALARQRLLAAGVEPLVTKQ